MPFLVTNKFRMFFQILVPLLFVVGAFFRDINHESLQAFVSQGPELCFIHRWTGLLCPGCGMTRAMISFFCFNLNLSFSYHPMGPLLGAFVIGLWGVSFYKASWPKALHWIYCKVREHTMALAIIVCAWGIYRNF